MIEDEQDKVRSLGMWDVIYDLRDARAALKIAVETLEWFTQAKRLRPDVDWVARRASAALDRIKGMG